MEQKPRNEDTEVFAVSIGRGDQASRRVMARMVPADTKAAPAMLRLSS
jgi:hypothetical protein